MYVFPKNPHHFFPQKSLLTNEDILGIKFLNLKNITPRVISKQLVKSIVPGDELTTISKHCFPILHTQVEHISHSITFKNKF